MMKTSISIVTTLFVLVVLVMGTNIQAFSQNTTATNGPTNPVQSQLLQAMSESSNATFGGASPELKTLFQNQDINASILPSLNTTLTGEKRPGSISIDTGNFEPTDVSITYEVMGNDSENSPVRTGLFQGDILVVNDNPGAGGKVAPDKFITTSKWTNGIIPVAIHPDTPNKENIIEAMTYVMNNSPMIFRPVEVQNDRIVDENFLVFLPSTDGNCFSNIGMLGGAQFIHVSDWCKTVALVHELGHTQGLWHEQTRCDRDDFIRINWNNIKDDWKDQFTSVCGGSADPSDSPASFGDYDLCSIMHYPTKGNLAAAIDTSQPIMIPLQEPQDCSVDDIGRGDGYSPLDREGITALYPFF